MSKTLKRILAMVLVICALLSYTVPAAYATDWTGITDWTESLKTKVTYNFNQLSYYTGIPEENEKTGLLRFLLEGYTSTSDSTAKTPMTDRYLAGDQNWTYEAASSGLCGNTTDNEHLPNSNVRILDSDRVLRIAMAKEQNSWIAFRIKSPGAGTYSMKLNFYSYVGSPTVACYILDAEGEASIDHDTVLARQERIQTEMDPNNRIGKVDQNAASGTSATKDNTAYIGSHTFEANKEYILVFETYETAAVPEWYACFSSVIFTKDGAEGEELTGDPEVSSILVEKNLVPAADGGYMAAVTEVNGHDYYFRPLEGGKMVIYDLDKHVAGEESLVATVTTGLYYPTHATATDDGRVIVGGDGKKLFIFDTKTMTGRTTPDFRSTEGLEDEGHNQGAHYGSDGYLYFGTLYGGHLVQYDIDARTYTDLGDVVNASVRKLAGITANTEEETGGVRATCYHDGYLYAKVDSDSYTLIVKQDVANKTTVAAIDVTDQLHGSGVPHGITVLGDKYLIAGGNGGSGMVLIDLATFKLVTYDQVVSKGLFSSKTAAAKAAWENGMGGHASEVINGKQYFYVNDTGMYSYDVNTYKMEQESTNDRPLRTGQKAAVTLDMDDDGIEEIYVLTFAGSGPRLFNISTKKSSVISDLVIDTSAVGGSSLNIGDSYNDVLYIGAWNNYNCVAYDTGAEAIKSRYVTGGQTDSQVSYVDDDGTFHLVSGNYSACVVYEIDPDNKTGYNGKEDTNILMPLISNMKQYEQKRIHTVAGGDGYVFAGTIPTSYVTGGGVGVYNRATDTEDFIRFKETSVNGEKVVSNSELWDLAVQCVEYYDGRLFGTTTRSGGSGSKPVDGTSARIFVLDYENMAIEATLDLRDYLTLVDANGDGAEDPITYIGGIQVDDQGRFWGLCSDVLFCFTYDKSTKTFAVKEVLNLGHSAYETSAGAAWKSHKVAFDPANYQMFVSFYSKGLQQVVLGENNWKAAVADIDVAGITTTQILDSDPATFALGANNNLYYVSGTNLYMKPVNVADDDAAWTNAQNVDDMLEALGDITADKADDVAAAKAAYNALTLREKALVQETRFLKEVEAQVLELQIEEAIANVTVNSVDKLGELIVQYNALEADQQRYVQNYTALETAYSEAIDLNYYAAANAVVEQIAALNDPATLADEEAVVAARKAYDMLDAELQSKVTNLSKLEAAEANIAALKQEAADVQALIDALTDITLDDKENVTAARTAYDALSDEQKALVDATNLEAAEARIIVLEGAQAVQDQIDALTDITLEDEAEVQAVRAAYEALTDDQKAQIDTAKLEAAEAQIADLKAAQTVQVQINALPETVTLDDEDAVKAARKAYNALSTDGQATVDTTKLVAAEAQLAELLKLEGELQVYDFNLFENEAYMTYIKNKLIAKGAAEDVIVPGHNLYKITVGDISYSNPYSWFNSAFSSDVNWTPEGSDGYVPTNFGKDYTVKDGTGLMLTFVKPAESTKQNFGAVRINVPSAGSFKLDLSLYEGSNSSRLATGDVLDVYIIPAYEDYKPSTDNYGQIKTYLADNTYYAGSLTYTTQANETDTTSYTINEAFALNAGEYIVVIRENAIGTCRYVYLDSLTLIENVTEEEAVATVGGRYFRALNNALEYQTQSGADTVSLVADAVAEEVSIPADAVLDLNGKTLKATAFDAVAPGAQVIDSTGGNGALVVAKGENLFAETNAQLPVYDEAVGGYRFFEVSVKSVATTGKGSADPKYWFQVSAVNFDEIYKLIKAGSELNITVKMTWSGGEGDAVASVDFLNKWADAFANNENIYITVSAVNTEGLEDFSLIPALAANGVEISGKEM